MLGEVLLFIVCILTLLNGILFFYAFSPVLLGTYRGYKSYLLYHICAIMALMEFLGGLIAVYPNGALWVGLFFQSVLLVTIFFTICYFED